MESLKQEIEELKHHLNSNYDVYVRRLEKSKAKRKDLEANLREVTAENERLSREADQGESKFLYSRTKYRCIFIKTMCFSLN